MLDEYWTRNFSNALPLAHLLRDEYASRWFRIHSLPDSKRHAEDDNERKIVLERFNTLAAEFASDGTQLELLTTNWSTSPLPESPHPGFGQLEFQATAWRSIAMHELDGDSEPYYSHIFQSSLSWRGSALNPVIRLVADDRLSNVMVLDTSSNWLLHPYDGGLDIICDSSQIRDVLANKYQHWRPSRSDGL
ncbi:MAG: hypothetical protein JWN70_6904 [Planctomycetaceae bacterium]|nr:hypothetical protein [Planctomycetaceae bacterium]